MQVRGKKNLVIEKSLAGPVGVFIKFSTLQDYGVDKVFFLENDNVDASQKSVIFLARGEKASQCIAIAGKYVHHYNGWAMQSPEFPIIYSAHVFLELRSFLQEHIQWDKK